MTTGAPGMGYGVQKANSEMAEEKPTPMNTFHTPKRSARGPQTTRPKNDPV